MMGTIESTKKTAAWKSECWTWKVPEAPADSACPVCLLNALRLALKPPPGLLLCPVPSASLSSTVCFPPCAQCKPSLIALHPGHGPCPCILFPTIHRNCPSRIS